MSFIFIQLQLKGTVAKESSPRANDLNHISGRINEICTSFALVIHCYMSQFHRHTGKYPDSYHKKFQTAEPIGRVLFMIPNKALHEVLTV